MLLEPPRHFEEYGKLRIYRPSRVLEIDAFTCNKSQGSIQAPDMREVEKIACKTIIVVPIKNESLLKLLGVISGIPHVSTVIVVSASKREGVDKYRSERDALRNFHRETGRKIILFHQHDPAWKDALDGSPLEGLLDKETGTVKRGKGEGMLLGLLMASRFGAEYVGFIDSDNYSPGAVHEYVWAYYSGFLQASSQHSMVRLKWPYKGKLAGGELPYLRKRGRVSSLTNDVLNYAVSLRRSIETDIIQTANSGEHAVSVKLGLSIAWAGGFAVEPYQFVYLLEKCWLSDWEAGSLVEVFQVETRSPHIHAERGKEHINNMLRESLSTIYYSELATEEIKEMIRDLLVSNTGSPETKKPTVYPPPGSEWPSRITGVFESRSEDYYVFE